MCVERHTRQPITHDMIDIMMNFKHQDSSAGDFGWTTSGPAHYDWMILGLFMGYRIGEYTHTTNCYYDNCARGACGDGSGEFVGTPLAACHPDFLFFDFCTNTFPYTHKLNFIGFVEICSAPSMHCQNNLLCPPWPGPGVFSSRPTPCAPPLVTGSHFLHSRNRGRDVKSITVERFLKKAMIMAYPDPNHRLRHLERCFMSHCFHISA
jgi:hypothetical protein